ncbi:MAG: hypothetical protein J6M02_07090 [Clostridia bacterium]|nr:hypothetical protein [Spirochaetales bacterium]MBP3285245.1 hypothetical protein [Clostridia bacterium]
MFKELYLKADAKIKPDLKLINETKAKMLREINAKKNVKQIHFYKYATLAACFILVISLFSVNVKNASNQVAEDLSGVANSSLTSNSANGLALPNTASSSANNSFSSVTVDSASEMSSVSKNPIIEFFMKILQWFQELLF